MQEPVIVWLLNSEYIKCTVFIFSGNIANLANNKQQIGLVGMLIGIGEITGMCMSIRTLLC